MCRADKLGLIGELIIDFKQEMVNLPVAEIVQDVRDITKSLSLYATKEIEWGTIALRPVSISTTFESTRPYSPDFLENVFGVDLESMSSTAYVRFSITIDPCRRQSRVAFLDEMEKQL